MALPIERSRARYKQIVRGKIRENLGKYIRNSELIGRKGKDLVSIPITHIDLPKLRHYRNSAGAGMGGNQIGPVGTPLGPSGDQPGGGAGDTPGGHIREVEITIEELAEIMGEELELPRIIPKGKRNITEEKDKYTGVRKVGPEGLMIKRRTLKNMLLRSAQLNPLLKGFFDPAKHRVYAIPEDKRYLSWKTIQKPMAAAVIIYIMDVSGSMTEKQKEIARIECFWINTWLKSQYEGLRTHYIIHDAVATEVDEETFFTTRESGGTKISSAYRLCNKLMKELPGGVADWNVYAFQFSDGDNWGEDNEVSVSILREEILPEINLFGYVQVKSPYGSGEFLRVLNESFKDNESLLTVEVEDKDDILSSIKKLLSKGN